jgi:CRP-like cAMP-binding protein
VDLFRHCRAEEVVRLAAIASQRSFAAGERVYEQGDAADALFCVVRGAVALEGPDGERRRVGPLVAFGVVEVLLGRMRATSAVAEGDTLALVIEADDFFDLLANNIEIVKALFRQFVQPEQALAAAGGSR